MTRRWHLLRRFHKTKHDVPNLLYNQRLEISHSFLGFRACLLQVFTADPHNLAHGRQTLQGRVKIHVHLEDVRGLLHRLLACVPREKVLEKSISEAFASDGGCRGELIWLKELWDVRR